MADREKHYQELKEVFSDPDAVVLCEDEMVLTEVTTTRKVWIPKGVSRVFAALGQKVSSAAVAGFYPRPGSGFSHQYITPVQHQGDLDISQLCHGPCR